MDSIDAVALTEATENAVETITTEYRSSEARCNTGVATAFEDLAGSTELNDKKANQMYDHMEGSDEFEKVEQSEMQDLANDGTIVIPAKKEDGSGHVVMGVPREEANSTTWDENVPQVMDTGANKRESKQKISGSWGASSKNNITYFKYTGETYTSRTYSGGTLTGVTVSARIPAPKRMKPKLAMVVSQ